MTLLVSFYVQACSVNKINMLPELDASYYGQLVCIFNCKKALGS
jgi:hypothetical protein